MLTRCSQPLSTNQTPHTPPPKTGRQQPTPTSGAQPLPVPPHTGRRSSGLVVSKPNSVFSDSFTDKNPAPAKRLLCTQPATHYRRRRSSPNHRFPHGCGGGGTILVLLRKEVIQPHLPVRLPCYDFVPITDPTFGSSLLAVGPLTSGVTDFRDVTGGVYKARERIHRSVADLRLLATPTSRGRVADPDPN